MPLGRPLRRLDDRPPKAATRVGAARLRRGRLGAGPGDRVRSDRIEPRMAPPVRPIAVRSDYAVEARRNPRCSTAARTSPGFVRLTVRGAPGDRVVVRHAEVLERDGSLHTKSLRSARATDSTSWPTTAVTTLEPAFTFHGFRYAEVETDGGAAAGRNRRHQQRHPRAQHLRMLGCRFSIDSTRTSSGRSGATSYRSRRTAPSVTSVWAGRATRRPLPRRRRRSSIRRRSGEAGCATLRSTRTTTWACRASCLMSCWMA